MSKNILTHPTKPGNQIIPKKEISAIGNLKLNAG